MRLFAQKASYLFRNHRKMSGITVQPERLNALKAQLGIIAYTAMKYYGNHYYKDYIDRQVYLAATFASRSDLTIRLQLAMNPESNIVCFRYAPDGYDEFVLNKINAAIRDIIIKEGSFYIVQVELAGKIC